MAFTLKTFPFLLFVLCVNPLASFAAYGQPAAPTTPASIDAEQREGITVYEPEFFAPYRPTHAKDMLDRVPGAANAISNAGGGNLAGDDDRRGLRSQTTQVLINGKRLTTKDNSLQDYFERIPASQVERIEVITGNVREIDADVGSRVINVVLLETGRIGGTWRTDVVVFNDGQTEPVLSGSVSGETGNWSYTLAAETRPRQIPRKEFERFTDASNQTFQDSIEERRLESRRYIGRGRLAYDFGNNHQVQVSGFIEDRPIGNWD